MAKIEIQRKHNFIGMASKYRIYIDGEMKGKIANAKSQEFQLPAGNHTVMIKQFILFQSRVVEFSLKENEIKVFKVDLTGHMQMLYWVFIGLFFISLLSNQLNTPFSFAISLVMLFIIILLFIYFIIKRKDYFGITEADMLTLDDVAR